MAIPVQVAMPIGLIRDIDRGLEAVTLTMA